METFKQELRYGIVEENTSFSLQFITPTSRKLPDFTQTTMNGTERKFIASAERTKEHSDCQFFVSEVSVGGYRVNMSCLAAQPHHAGRYVGTDNDHADTAHKTIADVIIVTGACGKFRGITWELPCIRGRQTVRGQGPDERSPPRQTCCGPNR